MAGIDAGSSTHYARAFNNRKIEYSRKPLRFANSKEGFETFKEWAVNLAKENGKTHILVGMEPTGHYGSILPASSRIME